MDENFCHYNVTLFPCVLNIGGYSVFFLFYLICHCCHLLTISGAKKGVVWFEGVMLLQKGLSSVQ